MTPGESTLRETIAIHLAEGKDRLWAFIPVIVGEYDVNAGLAVHHVTVCGHRVFPEMATNEWDYFAVDEEAQEEVVQFPCAAGVSFRVNPTAFSLLRCP